MGWSEVYVPARLPLEANPLVYVVDKGVERRAHRRGVVERAVIRRGGGSGTIGKEGAPHGWPSVWVRGSDNCYD